MVWVGDNYPQEFEDSLIRAADMEPVDATDLAYGETDGAVSINALEVAKRLNDLLVIVQQLEDRLERHITDEAHP